MELFDCTVIGDIFMDIIIHKNAESNKSCHGGTLYSDFIKIEFGGSGNIAVGLSLLGAKASFVGKAGKDLFGNLYIENLKENKVITKVFFDESSLSGSILVSVYDQKERSFLVFRGANDSLSISDIKKTDRLIRGSRYMYFVGYSLINNPQRDAILYAIELSKKYKRQIVFDPGAHNIIKQNHELFSRIVSDSDVFTPNLEEALTFTNTKNINDAIDKLKGICPLTVLKCGEDGCVFINDKNIIKIPGFKVRCVDPTGAGDAFVAALIYGLARNKSLQDIGQIANWFASQTVTGNGARCFPKRIKTRDFIDSMVRKGVKESLSA